LKPVTMPLYLAEPLGRALGDKPDYFCLLAASKYLAGYGLNGTRRDYGSLLYVGARSGRTRSRAAARRAGRARIQ
jgi:hypothetical protein